jgi:hypothetical protein
LAFPYSRHPSDTLIRPRRHSLSVNPIRHSKFVLFSLMHIALSSVNHAPAKKMPAQGPALPMCPGPCTSLATWGRALLESNSCSSTRTSPQPVARLTSADPSGPATPPAYREPRHPTPAHTCTVHATTGYNQGSAQHMTAGPLAPPPMGAGVTPSNPSWSIRLCLACATLPCQAAPTAPPKYTPLAPRWHIPQLPRQLLGPPPPSFHSQPRAAAAAPARHPCSAAAMLPEWRRQRGGGGQERQ